MAGTAAIAQQYSPLSGLGKTSGLGGADGYFQVNSYQPPKIQTPTSSLSSTLPTGAAGSISTQAYIPDYGKLIAGDSGLLGIQSLLGANQAGDAAQRNAQIQQALIQFGEVPDLNALAQQLGMSPSDLQGVLGSNTPQLAQDATGSGLSTIARLQQAHDQGHLALINDLNKRGLLNSGEAGYQLDNEATQYRQAQFDARAKLLDYLHQYQQGFLQGQQARANQLAQAYSDAANRAYQNNQGTPSVQLGFAYQDANGKPVYTDGNGRYFNPDGSSYSGPGPAPQPSAPAAPTAPTASLLPKYSGGGGGRASLNI